MALKSIVGTPQLNALLRVAEGCPLGDFAEVGVYKGGSAQRLYKVAQRQGRELHLFDTFRGVPICEPDLDRHKVGDFADVDLPALREAMPEARFYVGTYPNTHPLIMGPLAFVHCDCDQYASYRAVIDNLWPLVVSGGILWFDDYPYLAGAKKAVEETFIPGELRQMAQRYFAVKD